MIDAAQHYLCQQFANLRRNTGPPAAQPLESLPASDGMVPGELSIRGLLDRLGGGGLLPALDLARIPEP